MIDDILTQISNTEPYQECDECEAIAEDLMKRHPELLADAREAKIKFLVYLKNADWLGKCSRTTGKWAYLTGYDYVIEVNGDFWDMATREQKEALILHELLHIRRRETSKGEIKWGIQKHDIEEFFPVIEIYGPWQPSLQDLFEMLKK